MSQVHKIRSIEWLHYAFMFGWHVVMFSSYMQHCTAHRHTVVTNGNFNRLLVHMIIRHLLMHLLEMAHKNIHTHTHFGGFDWTTEKHTILNIWTNLAIYAFLFEQKKVYFFCKFLVGASWLRILKTHYAQSRTYLKRFSTICWNKTKEKNHLVLSTKT